MGRYELITGKKIEESLDQKINRKVSIQSFRVPEFLDPVTARYYCEICGDVIPREWLNVGEDFLVCSKKSCWEKFLPPDLVEKFLKSKSRYDLLKEQNP